MWGLTRIIHRTCGNWHPNGGRRRRAHARGVRRSLKPAKLRLARPETGAPALGGRNVRFYGHEMGVRFRARAASRGVFSEASVDQVNTAWQRRASTLKISRSGAKREIFSTQRRVLSLTMAAILNSRARKWLTSQRSTSVPRAWVRNS